MNTNKILFWLICPKDIWFYLYDWLGIPGRLRPKRPKILNSRLRIYKPTREWNQLLWTMNVFPVVPGKTRGGSRGSLKTRCQRELWSLLLVWCTVTWWRGLDFSSKITLTCKYIQGLGIWTLRTEPKHIIFN